MGKGQLLPIAFLTWSVHGFGLFIHRPSELRRHWHVLVSHLTTVGQNEFMYLPKTIGFLLVGLSWAVWATGQCTTCHTTISNNQSGSITVSAGQTLCITSSGSFTGTITLRANSTLCNQGTVSASSLTTNSSSTIENHGNFALGNSINLNGLLTNTGLFEATGTFTSNAAIVNSGTFYNTGNFNNSTSGNTSLSNTGDFTVDGNFSNNNDLSNDLGAEFYCSGTFSNTSAGGASLINDGSLAVGAGFTNSNDLENTGTLTIDGDFNNTSSGAATIVNSGSATIKGDFINSNDLNNAGDFTISGDFSQSNTGSAEINNEGNLYFEQDVYSDNDIFNEGFITVGGTFTNKKWSGAYYSAPNSLLVVDSLVNENTITSTTNEYGQIQVVSYSQNSGSVATYLDVCILGNGGNWNSNTGTVNGNVTYCTTPVETPMYSLNIKVFLESCYNPTNGQMTTALRSHRVLPAHTPFSKAPWGRNLDCEVEDSVEDISTDMVDWVLVELRTGTSPDTKFFEKSFFLTRTGSLTDAKGNPAAIDTFAQASFYIVVEARNHLGVMSASQVSVIGGAIQYDFTADLDQAYSTGAPAMVEVEPGVFALIGGDANADGTINALDAMDWHDNNNDTGYLNADLNFDNLVNNSDKNIWKTRNGLSIQYPK